MTGSLVALHQCGLTYPGPPEVTALRPTDLAIGLGEHVAVVGPSGSGKSTLLKLLGLLDRPTTGSYLFDGVDTSALPDRTRTAIRGRRMGFVFQAFHLLSYRSALENVELGQLYTERRPERRAANAARALDAVGLSHRSHALPTTLSGGEAQRVAIARALVAEPTLLLCDEPTGNLDSANARGVLDIIDHLHHQGMTIVIITHDPAVAGRAQRTLTIRDGELTEGA